MKQKIPDSLRRAAEQLPQANYNTIRDADVAPMEKHDHITRQMEEKNRRPMRRLAAAAVCLVCLIGITLGGGWYWQYGMGVSVVDIDLNPSYDIVVNRHNQVIEIKPMNEEAERVLQGRNYKGWDMEEAIYTLFSDLPEYGFLESDEPIVLVSVWDKNEERAVKLEEQVSNTIALTLLGTRAAPTVVTQVFSGQSVLKQQAAQYGVSPGKMYIVNALLEQNAPYTESQLANMDIGELVALAHEYGLEGLSDHYYPSYLPEEDETPMAPAFSVSSSGQPASSTAPAPAATPPPTSTQPSPSPTPTQPSPPPPLPTDDDSPYDDGGEGDDSPYEEDD